MKRLAGFTLVEVLVGLALTSLIATGLYSALFGIARTARVAAERNHATDTRRLTQRLFHDVLQNAVPFVESARSRTTVLFRGERDRVRFIGHLPAHAAGGGLQLIELHRRNDLRGPARIELSFRAAWPTTAFDAPLGEAGWTGETIARGVASLEIEYYGRKTVRARAAWSDEWAVSDELPELIRIRVDTDDGEWPPIVVPLRVGRSAALPAWFREAREALP
jgi:general secretion pathway protein J